MGRGRKDEKRTRGSESRRERKQERREGEKSKEEWKEGERSVEVKQWRRRANRAGLEFKEEGGMRSD